MAAEGGTSAGSSVLDVLTTLGPAFLTLTGVWLGSRFTRGREDRSWRRSQLVSACSDFIRATSAVEQWAASDQFAARLGAGQYPTDYKNDLERLEAAVAVVSISTPQSVSTLATQVSVALREYVHANAKYQAEKPKGNPMDPSTSKQMLAAWKAGGEGIEESRRKWRAMLSTFIDAARAELDVRK